MAFNFDTLTASFRKTSEAQVRDIFCLFFLAQQGDAPRIEVSLYKLSH